MSHFTNDRSKKDGKRSRCRAQQKRIAELEEALKLTNDELSKTIDEVNNSLKFINICSSDIDDPDYWDKQTCHENQILLKEQGE